MCSSSPYIHFRCIEFYTEFHLTAYTSLYNWLN